MSLLEAGTRCEAQRRAAAARMRLVRQRRAAGALHIRFDVFAEGITTLVELGWLAAADAGNREAIKGALADFVAAAAAAGIRPDRR